MEELLKALEKLWESGNFDYKTSEEYETVVGLANENLITENGRCKWSNIHQLEEHGYRVMAGEKDSFGWLTAIIRKKGDNDSTHSVLYG